MQALIGSGLDTLARDADFVSVTKREMAEAMRADMADIEGVARVLLSSRKRRPIPAPPSANFLVPSVSEALREGSRPAAPARRKKRPSAQHRGSTDPADEADSNV